ncbi:phosphoglyceromutase [Encephalitozoon cuniculi EcunIII-L]|uniref:phosphoglycerate mutase (2,3-diphosphoglycerate-independent) n=1 Tax=Encephalitozoon cuniculi TaxID=6035 RepID=M1KAB4_ENCCN|nr:phosphoglycerate mutase [Encephalitozoon cuniculi]KMV65258.1 phosphoglyceromutase [Encephalitozoon cuniculi EcunIII-L]UYI26567.1 2,3-bisphosphoglycerate-independent phosphoglycerate mutase [Encephalitozoon cuniculi]
MGSVCLVVIDGWGHDETSTKGNAVNESRCRWMRELSRSRCSFLLFAHGRHVGLPDGLMGNSEVGHLTIGSGRIIEQDIVRIDRAVEEGRLKKMLDKELQGIDGKIHVVGMVSDGGVHSHIRHLKAILEALEGRNEEVFVHCVSDGRDTEPRVFLKYLKEVRDFLRVTGVGKVASIAGRFYSMDRANNDERTELSFRMMTRGREVGGDIRSHICAMYEEGLSDETLRPLLIDGRGRIDPKDTIIFFNFRADRMRQIASKFAKNGNSMITMTEYKKDLGSKVLFKKICVKNTLAEVLSSRGIRHSHIAENEKQAHVTYFFNGGMEQAFSTQRTIILPSPGVQSFDAVPSMASREVAMSAVAEIEKGVPLVVVNLAPPDMVGHTGNFEATKAAVEATDECIGKIYRACTRNRYTLVITADHGNAEKMVDKEGGCCKTHTTSKVPLIICEEGGVKASSSWGYVDSDHSLRDVAPTVLEIMGIPRPSEMTGKSVWR